MAHLRRLHHQAPYRLFPVFRALAARMVRILALVATVAMCTPGCAGTPARYGSERFQGVGYDDYLRALERYTRDVQLYERLETRLLAHATLHTPQFRDAYLRELARTYRLSEAEETERARKLAEEAPGQVEVLVWASSSQPRNARLELRDSLWKLKLYNGQGQFAVPSSVTLVKKPSKADEHFYPYINGLGQVYRVRFPDRPDSGSLFMESSSVTLQLAGVLGVAELSWSLKD